MRFQDIIGQEEAVHHIQDAIANNRLAHALLLVGPSGVGSLALAVALTQYVNCLNPTSDHDSCGKCSSCIKISKGIHPDIKYVLPIFSKTEGGKRLLSDSFFDQFRSHFFEDPYFSLDNWQETLGGVNKQLFISVHEIRELKKGIYLKSFEAKYKVLIIWHAELINKEGANAFLKLLEEPPERTLIIMTCSDPSKLLTTINSRCQRIRLSRIPKDQVQGYLQNQRGLPLEEAQDLALISEGSISQATALLSSHNQTLHQVYIEWLRAIYKGDYQDIQDHVGKILEESKEFQKRFLQVAVRKMRDSLLYHLGVHQLALAPKKEQAFQENFAKVMNPDKVEEAVALIEDSLRALTGNTNPQMVLTALSLRMHGILRRA